MILHQAPLEISGEERRETRRQSSLITGTYLHRPDGYLYGNLMC
jgi:hypothetical protein